MSAGAAGERVDGRRKRSEASRQQIVRAMLEMIGAGDVSPSAEAVAASAGVGLRTVFRHFDNMESLYREINAAIAAEVRPMLAEPFASTQWRDRIGELIDRRVRIFERIMPYKIAGDVHRHRSPFLAKQGDALAREQRTALADVLPKEIRKNDTALQALDLLLSFETWRRLRKEQKLSVPKARKTLELLVRALLRDLD